jgi:hypothetical protein
MELFGFSINRKKEEKQQEKLVSFVPPTNDDGAMTVTSGGIYGTYVDLDGSVRTEAELVNKYRATSMDPVIDLAIQDICNEAIVEDSDEDTVSVVLDNIDQPDSIKKAIQEEFTNILGLLEFNRMSYEIFKRWYIDGRLYYHAVVDEKKPQNGIVEMRYIDPRNIKKIREIKKEKDPKTGATIEKIVNEYYMYSPMGFLKKSNTVTGSITNAYGGGSGAADAQGVKIARDSIVYCTSGYQNIDNKLILSYLQKAIRPLNQLRSMEDSLVIYRISRAPERRIFYVDVGGLPKAKAEQYLSDIMTKFKNKVVYDSATGEIRDDRKFMTMLEDFWLPRREGGKGTEITTLPGGQNLGEIEDVVYFQNKLYQALNVPISRLNPESTYTLGRATEISREEVKFSKFITRLRNKFSELFLKMMERQLILKQICTVEEWKEWRDKIDFKFAVDNYYDELKNMEMNRDRLGLLRDMDEYIGKYYSHEYIRRWILQQSEENIEEIDKQIVEEQKNPQYNPDFEEPEQEEPEQEEAPPPAAEPQAVNINVTTDGKKAEAKKEEFDQLQNNLIESMTRYLNDE